MGFQSIVALSVYYVPTEITRKSSTVVRGTLLFDSYLFNLFKRFIYKKAILMGKLFVN